MKSETNNSKTPVTSTEPEKSTTTSTREAEDEKRVQALVRGMHKSFAAKPKVH